MLMLLFLAGIGVGVLATWLLGARAFRLGIDHMVQRPAEAARCLVVAEGGQGSDLVVVFTYSPPRAWGAHVHDASRGADIVSGFGRNPMEAAADLRDQAAVWVVDERIRLAAHASRASREVSS